MKMKAVFNITELNSKDWLIETFEGTLEECLAWKSTKIEEFTDFVGFDGLDCLGYGGLIHFGGEGIVLIETEKEKYDVIITSKGSNFVTIFEVSDYGN